MRVSLGVKTDPIENRYTFEWLFDLMAECGVRHAQLGSFFAMYSLDREWFHRLREKAENRGVRIQSLFTSHRELGGFLTGDPALEKITEQHYRTLLDVGETLGVDFVGSNLGAVYCDRLAYKEEGIRRSLEHLKRMMHIAGEKKIRALTIEPMSGCIEPPTLPEECVRIIRELADYHRDHPETAPVYFCGDISHGYADGQRRVVADNWELFELQIPYLCEFHFKNTDAIFNSTFGFCKEERERGIVDLTRLRTLIERNASRFPFSAIVGYLEINNIKFGRDYSDFALGDYLRESLAAIRRAFAAPVPPDQTAGTPHSAAEENNAKNENI